MNSFMLCTLDKFLLESCPFWKLHMRLPDAIPVGSYWSRSREDPGWNHMTDRQNVRGRGKSHHSVHCPHGLLLFGSYPDLPTASGCGIRFQDSGPVPLPEDLNGSSQPKDVPSQISDTRRSVPAAGKISTSLSCSPPSDLS